MDPPPGPHAELGTWAYSSGKRITVFIADGTGGKVEEADRQSEAVLTATFDLDQLRAQRHAWGVFRDRRPELYYPILSLDGRVPG